MDARPNPENVNQSQNGGSHQAPGDSKENKSLQESYGAPQVAGSPGAYPPPQGAYPPPQGAYPPPQGAYPPPQGTYPPPQGAYPPPQGAYPPPQAAYPPPHGAYTPPQGGYGPPQGPYQPPPGAPITNQPTYQGGMPPTSEWMRMPQGAIPHCPPGLEYLTMIDSLLVHQKVELMEAISGYETENKYSIHNSVGQKVYQAVEMSDSRMRSLCGSLRPFELKILDNYGNLVINLKRPLACKWCCFPCCLQSLEVFAPPGNLVGSIEQEWSVFFPKFSIKSPNGDVVLRIEGPFCTMACCTDVDFKVLSSDGSNQVGKISKQWAGYVKEAYTAADNFGISFPMDLDVKMKAVMVGACFLIDMMYYEERPSSNSNTNKTSSSGPQPQPPHQPI